MPTLEQVTAARLDEIRDIAESGLTEMTGKARREYGREGAFVGRYRGMKHGYKELEKIADGPKQIAAAIRRGKGKVYDRVYRVVSERMEREGYKPAKKRGSKPSEPPHAGRAYCRHCRVAHTRGQHRFHGAGSFHRTHLFSFNKKTMNVKDAKRIFAALMQTARARPLTPDERKRLQRASQLIRYAKRGTAANPRKRATSTRRNVSKAEARRIHAATKARVGGPEARAIYRRAKKRGYIAKNPGGLIRMGRLVELRYQRDHGGKRGLYKHPFASRPTIYYDVANNTIIIR